MTGYFKESDGKTCTECTYPCTVCYSSSTHCLYCADFPTKTAEMGNRLPPLPVHANTVIVRQDPVMGVLFVMHLVNSVTHMLLMTVDLV